MIRTLLDVVGSANDGAFLEHYLNKETLFLQIDGPGRAELLLPWAEIDRVALAATPKVLRLALNGHDIEPRLFTDPETGAARADTLQVLAAQGATFIFKNICTQVPPIGALAAAIERQLLCHVWVNCYVSFGEHSAFLKHHDNHDVLILQIWGAKRWRTYGTRAPFPLEGEHFRDQLEPVWEGVLRSGDVLYVPRGEIHAAVPVDRPSVHLTIGLGAPRGVEFAKWVSEQAECVERLRMDLARFGDTDRRARDQSEVSGSLLAQFGELTISDYLKESDRKRVIRPVVALNVRQRLTTDCMLGTALRRQLDLEIENDDELPVEIGGKLLRLSAAARRVLHVITNHGRISVASLATELGWQVEDEALADGIDELAKFALIAVET